MMSDSMSTFYYPVVVAFVMVCFYAKRGPEKRSLDKKERNLVITFFAVYFLAFHLVLTRLLLLLINVFNWHSYVPVVGMLGTYFSELTLLLFLSRFDVFTRKQKIISRVLCIVGMVPLIGAARLLFDPETVLFGVAALLVPICTLCGYFLPKGEKSNAWYYFVGFGWIIYVPLIILVLLAGVVYFCIKLMFGGKASSPRKGKRYEVVDGGVKYIIEETNNGTYFDDCNREWFTDDNGTTFYRKD